MPSGPFVVSVRADMRPIIKSLSALQKKQLPFAFALALTATAKRVQAAEQRAMPTVFDRPTPFTVKSVGVKAALKNRLQAVVFVKDIAAAYLMPFEFGGNHKLIGSGLTWLNPKDKSMLNQYGNFSRQALKKIEANPNVFIGSIKTKSGETIGGVWERPPVVKVGRGRRRKGTAVRAPQRGNLKLLIRFGDAMPVKQHLNYRVRAQAIAGHYFKSEFEVAMKFALRTAK